MCSSFPSSGPCFFLSCPVTVDEFRSWFIDLWNHSIIPYLQEGAKDGIKVTKRSQQIQFTVFSCYEVLL